MAWRILFLTWLIIFIAGISVRPMLLEHGIINTKDLPPFIGTEQGTVFEFIMNTWHWDIAGFAIALLLIPVGFIASVSRSSEN